MAKDNPFLGIPWWLWLIGGGVVVVFVWRSVANQALSTVQTMQAQQAAQQAQAQAQMEAQATGLPF